MRTAAARRAAQGAFRLRPSLSAALAARFAVCCASMPPPCAAPAQPALRPPAVEVVGPQPAGVGGGQQAALRRVKRHRRQPLPGAAGPQHGGGGSTAGSSSGAASRGGRGGVQGEAAGAAAVPHVPHHDGAALVARHNLGLPAGRGRVGGGAGGRAGAWLGGPRVGRHELHHCRACACWPPASSRLSSVKLPGRPQPGPTTEKVALYSAATRRLSCLRSTSTRRWASTAGRWDALRWGKRGVAGVGREGSRRVGVRDSSRHALHPRWRQAKPRARSHSAAQHSAAHHTRRRREASYAMADGMLSSGRSQSARSGWDGWRGLSGMRCAGIRSKEPRRAERGGPTRRCPHSSSASPTTLPPPSSPLLQPPPRQQEWPPLTPGPQRLHALVVAQVPHPHHRVVAQRDDLSGRRVQERNRAGRLGGPEVPSRSGPLH